MSDPLTNYLEQLHCLPLSDVHQRGVVANNIVVDLSSFCLGNPPDRELAYCSSVLFHEKKGIINFLKETVSRDEEICVKLFSQDHSNKVKGETFSLLTQIFEVKLEPSVVEQLNVPKMIDKYFSACMQPTKHSSTVKSGLYALLGTFAEVFPEHMIRMSDRLVSIYTSVLKSEMMSKTKKPDMPVIAGCLRGLASYLTNFTQSVEEGSKYSREIYCYARKAIDPQVNLNRYDVPRAGLQLFAKHAAQFKEYISKDYEDMYESFYRWCRHHNRDMSYAGYLAMETFLKQMAEYLVLKNGDKSEMTLFKYFVKKFQSIIDSASSDTKQTSIAIRGYGYFAKPCKLILPPGDVNVMFSQMMERSEQIYLRQDELEDDKVQHLPSFLEALSCIVQELDEVSDSILSSLERLGVVLFSNFTRLAKGPKLLCCKALVHMLLNLAGKGPVIRRFLSELVYQGLIRTCSHPVALEEVNEITVGEDGETVDSSPLKTSYKDYLPLWEFLLEKGRFKDVSLIGQKHEQHESMHGMLYDEMIQAILRVIHKLDLSSFKGLSSDVEDNVLVEASNSPTAQQDNMCLSDPVSGLQPKVPKDFLIFINLIEFCKCVLPKCSVNLFENWLYVFGREIIVMSTRFPVVSGFYKLLEVCMKICEKLSFFKYTNTDKLDDNNEELDMEIVDKSDRRTCFDLFRKFMKEVLVRIQQYKDDLLVSCLRLVLSLPLKLVKLDVASLVPAVKLTFKLGLSYTPLAQAGLDALQKWSASLPTELLNPHLSEVLPCLDCYLKSSADSNEEGQLLSEDSKTIVLSTGTRLGSRRKIPLKLLKIKKESKESPLQSTMSPLARVRHQILKLLGSLGAQKNILLLGTKKIDPSKVVAWDSENHLGFAVPFQDMKPEIALDPFLPRLVELATTSSCRQTKVAACEALHSLVLYMLGKSVTQPHGKESPMEKLWRHVFPCLLQLACDVEQVAQQLFEPLVFQLIHWFTNNRKYESPETIALLDAIMDGVVHYGEAVLRDFSAQCVREFLHWSIKQTSEKQLEKSPINVKSLLKRMYSLALHPSAAKRLGAALAFNNIYTIFREESSLVDIFVIEILATYVESLSLAHNDDQAKGTQEQCVKVIEHLERILKVNVKLLSRESKRRRIPRGFGTLNSITLVHVIPWLLQQCGKPNTECRHQCMRLFCQLVPHVPGVTSAADWITKTYEEDPMWFVHRFEGGGGGQNGIKMYPTLSDIGGPFSLKGTFVWFDFLLAALDCYTWSFSQKLLSPSQVFRAATDGTASSVLFTSLNFFVTKLAAFGITAAKHCFAVEQTTVKKEVFTPKEIDSYNKAKCTLIIRIMNFLEVLLQVSSKDTFKIVPAEFWSESIFNIVLSCVMEPGVIGFNMGDIEVIEKLPEQTGAVCKMFAKKLPRQFLDGFKDVTRKKIALGSHCNLFDELPIPLCGPGETEVDHLRLGHLVLGYQQLHAAGLLYPALAESTPEQFAGKLLSSVYEGVNFPGNRLSSVKSLTPASKQLACKLLEFAFELGLKHDTLMESIMQESKMHSKDADPSRGLTFYMTFQTSIDRLFIREPNVHVPQILTRAASCPFLTSCMLNGILDHVTREAVLRKRHGSSVVAAIVGSWSSLDAWHNENSSKELKEAMLMIIKKMLLLDPKLVTDHSQSFFPSFFETYLNLLSDKLSTQAFKSQVLELLPHFSKLPEKQMAALKKTLDSFVALNFPLKSTEFIFGSPQYNDYIQALDKLLSAFVKSKCLMLLELLMTIICRESRHVHEDQIQKSLITFIQSCSQFPDQAEAALDMCFAVFLNERDYRSENRRAVIERVCMTFLLNTSLVVVRHFYVHHIKEIMGIIESKQAKTSDPSLESQVTSKLCCFELVEIMYSRLSKSELNTPESTINRAYVAGEVKTGKEMTMAITKAARSVVTEDMRGETLNLELRRQYHCFAYNCLVALISCTQTELKFFVAFLFSENPVKGQFLLDNLIDCTKTHEFEVELTAPIEKRKQLTAIRKEVEDTDDESGSPGVTAPSVHYMCSQYLADSSLSEDVSQYDFSTPIQAYSSTELTTARFKPSTSKEESYHMIADTVEMDELNSHECMAKIRALLKHLLENKISPVPAIGAASVDMPGWMSPLYKKFISPNTHLNICLFIAKLAVNEPQMFEPYAKYWITPLTELILRMKDSEQPGTEGINYFIVDLVVTMLSWNSTALPEDRYLTSKLLEFVMTRAQHRNRSVFKNNLEIIKTMVEIWKSRLEVPSKVIVDNISNPDPTKKDNAVGIQLLGIIAANGLSLSHDATADKERFYSCLTNNLTFKYKEVYAAAAEVIGLLLKQAADVQKVFDGTLHDMVSEKLMSLVSSARPEPDKFITCVHKLQQNYPPIADRFVNQILFKLPSVYGDFKTYCLEILCSRAENITNLFTELKTKGLKDILTCRDEGSQVAVLKILQRLLKKLTVAELQFIFPSVTAFISHPSILCRELMYDILIWTYDTLRSDEVFGAEEGAAEILVEAKDHLLQGLADDNRELKLKLRTFWGDESRLPGTTLERLVEVLRAMYSPSTENQYLGYTTNLILYLTFLSPDYERLMFEQPLSECKFQEYQINYSWQQRHLVMTPLFAATQSSFGPGMTQTQESMSVDGVFSQLRATQNLQFTPTQDQGRSQTIDWLNPSQEAGSSQLFVTTSPQSQSSLLFSSSQRKFKGKILKPVPSDFGSQRVDLSQESSQQSQGTSGKEVLRLKRRFLKESDSSAFFAKREAMRKKLRMQAKERTKAARESRVVMYRKYRTGDLPDIQIKFSELIAPLQAVAQRDSTFAKKLFSVLFRGIFSQIEKKLSVPEAANVASDINTAMNNMVSSSTNFFPAFISSIQDICYHEHLLSIDPTSVSAACLTSLQQPIGIMLLEKQLLQSEDSGKSSRKRARGSAAPPSQETITWIELSRLYRSLGDYDVLRGIFTGHIGTKPITQKALEAEARGDFSQALKLYNEAIATESWPGGEPQREEEDLWDDGRLQCFANLTQWENVEKFSLLSIDDGDTPDIDKVWTDPFFQEHYLPYLITSKLKLQCQRMEDQSLNSFVTRAMRNNDWAALLQSRHSDSLALMYLLQDDYDRALYFTGYFEQSFLMDWAGLDSTMSSSRSAKLQPLQKMAEMQEFLEFIAQEENFSSTNAAESMFHKWSYLFPDPRLHPIVVWDDIVTNRIVYMRKILRKFETADTEERSGICLGGLKQSILQHEVQLHLRMANTAKEQGNYQVGNKCLREALKLIPEDDYSLQISWSHVYAKMNHKKIQSLTDKEAVETSLTIIGQLDKFCDSKILENEPLRALEQHILRSQTFDIITKAIFADDGSVLSALDDGKKETLARLCGVNSVDSHKKVVSQLMTRSFKALQSSIKAAKNAEEGKRSGSSCGMVQALMAMVNFCDDCLRKNEEDTGVPVEVDTKLFPGIVVRYMLKAMCYGSDQALQRFPRLLQIVEMYPDTDTVQAFITKAAVVPSWMFIGWINQMLAILDKREGKAVQAILWEIAQTYPQALWYPFKISSEQFVFDNSKEGKTSQDAVKSLQSALESPLMNDFISALEQLTDPEMSFKDWCDGSMRQLLENKDKRTDAQAIRDCYKSMFQNLFESGTRAQNTSQIRGNDFGPVRKRFAQDFSGEVQKLFGKEGEKLIGLKVNQFTNQWRAVHRKMEEKGSRSRPVSNLKDYSPWLFHFQSNNYTHALEIPGQYTGREKPLPEYHVKITGFDERVKVLISIRKPKRIIIRGDDEKEYAFLVKGGEDLRLDQRIEQLFGLMNDVMASDPACSQRGLRLRTYQVIPMTPRVGLIEWIQNTKPFKDVLQDAMTQTELDNYRGNDGPRKRHAKWIQKFKGDIANPKSFYGEMYKKANRTETERSFQQKVGQVPWDLLRRSFIKLAASPEAFLILRSHFAKTHSCLSICQYILGIGDRHLSNFMVDMETGEMIGIDFGHAFGSATQFLPVPELMPFRLTRQFINLMLPLKESGTLQSVMVHTLRALRSNHELLVNTMDVFIKEPSLDWQVFARKQARAHGKNTDDGDVAWYPRQKIQNAKKKLEGFNPAYVMRDDLALGHKSTSWYKSMENVCLGDAKTNIRAQEPESGLSVESQVACLIDHAIDPNILGRTYDGWEPWM
ncbi:DNA-dependent protein kinase catalytic subunit-like isoform X2 [Acropora muricata]|uniref:DNA-dependent protein kinase catalytic subunit-like isoform X2 n=1 Tax=Acropora muricata TaxID=159855 RepID=UPI0034E3BEAC